MSLSEVYPSGSQVTDRLGRGLREEREKGKLVVQSDSAEGKLPHARVFIQNDLVPNEDTGADPT